MKKAKFALIIITLMICVFTCGLLVGRNLNRSNISTININSTSATSETTNAEPKKININTATIDELTLLPGIGQTLAQRIVDYRERIGPFRTKSDLCNVEGIGNQKLLLILDYIII